MRVVVDYGIRSGWQPPPPAMPGPVPGTDQTSTAAAVTRGGGPSRDPVVVIRRGAAENSARTSEPLRHADIVGRGPEGSNSPGGTDAPGLGSGATEEQTTPEAINRDRVVRRHEQAHQAALGGHAASGIQLQTARGADGEALAVGGRIKVELSEVPGNPRATLQKANTVRMAALAVSDPSAADLRVAAEAYRLARDARAEIAADRSGASGRAGQVNELV